MKKVLLFTLLFSLAAISDAAAQSSGTLSRDILISGDAELPADEEAVENAQDAARKLLDAKPQNLRQQNFPKLRRQRHSAAQSPIAAQANAAPFGLVWGATAEQIKTQGVELTPIEEKDYVNSFSARRLPKSIADFDQVNLTFGEEDKLWRIIAYSTPLQDTPDASKVMRLYNIYSDLLAKKYGNAQEFFTPAEIEIQTQDERGRPAVIKERAPIGNPDFLNQLQNGTAVLYSTFDNKDVGAALAVNVDGDGKSYIVIDYKNLKILRNVEKQTLDAL